MFIAIIVLSTIVQGLIALFVLQKNSKSLTNILFFSLSISLMAWAGINFIITSDPFSSTQLILYRVLMTTVVVQNMFFFLFAHTYPNQKIDVKPKKLKLYLALSMVAAAVALSPFLFLSVEYGSEGARPIAGPGMLLFVLHAALSISSGLYSIYKRYKSSISNQKKQLRLIFIGAILLWGIVPLTNFVFSLATQTLFFASISPIYTLVFSSLIAYAIVKHRAFDVRLVVARSVAYVLLISTLIGLYALVIFGFTANFINQESTFATKVVPILAALFLAGTAPIFKRVFDRLTDHLFFRKSYSIHEAVNEISSYTTLNVDAKKIQSYALKVIDQTIRPEYTAFLMFSKDGVLELANASGAYPSQMLQLEGFVDELSKLRQKIIISDDVKDTTHIKHYLELGHIGVIVRLSTSNKSIGFLILSEKKNGSLYSAHDLQFLNLLANDLALALQNAIRYEEIQAFNATLQYKINDATKALKRTNEKLIALDDAKDDFIGMASHQLRTPLTSIKGYISMILDGDLGKVNSVQRQALKEAFDSSQRMVYLISDFLNVSRIRTGKFTLETVKTDLTRIVSEEIGQLRDMAGLRGQKIIFEPPANLPIVRLDEMKIRQVMMNMIDNAIFYTPKEGNIEIVLEQNKNEIIFKVIDNGIGVPLADQHRMFTKFFRASNAKNARPDGTGLGLFMAQKIITAQEGKVIFKSTEGKGSIFGFRFPLSKVALKV